MGTQAKKIYNLTLIILSVVLVIGVIIYSRNTSVSMLRLKDLKIGYIIPLVAIQAFGLFLLGLTHRLPLKKHNITIKTSEWFGLSVVAEMFNMVLPANGGTGVRMMYLKDKKNLPIRLFLSMNFAMIVTGFTMLGMVGTLYFQYIFVKKDAVFIILESIFTALALTGILMLLASEIVGKIFKIKKKFSPKLYLFDPKMTAFATTYWLLFFATYPVKIYLSFLSLGLELNFLQSFEISMILILTYFFQVIPGNLGVKEIATAHISTHYGINFETALLASLIDRGTLLLFVLPFGMYFYWSLFFDAMPMSLQSYFKKFKPIQSEQTSP